MDEWRPLHSIILHSIVVYHKFAEAKIVLEKEIIRGRMYNAYELITLPLHVHWHNADVVSSGKLRFSIILGQLRFKAVEVELLWRNVAAVDIHDIVFIFFLVVYECFVVTNHTFDSVQFEIHIEDLLVFAVGEAFNAYINRVKELWLVNFLRISRGK